MDSIVSICNIALANLGANLISSLDEGSAEALLINAHWDNARRSTLSAHPWNFAIKRIELPQDTATPPFEYKYQYTLPADCLRVLRIFDSNDYRIEGRKVVTNDCSCKIKYVADITDVSAWTDAFRDLVAARIRSDLAYGITKSSNEAEIAYKLYKAKLLEAQTIDSTEDFQDDFAQGQSALISVRY